MTNTKDRETFTTSLPHKHNQFPIGIVLAGLIIIFAIFLAIISLKLFFYWITGIAFGFVLQKSRFCFTASLRDPYLTGATALTRAVLIALAITTIGFTAIKYGAFISGQTIPGQDYINSINLATAIGGILFGIGMVIAGGCASGTLMRVGEGYQTQLISFFFFIIGSLWGAHDTEWWHNIFVLKANGIFLPDILGWSGALVTQLLFIGLLYILAQKWEDRDSD